MQKRLFGILASVAVIVAACGGATSSSAPPASAAAPGGSEAPAASAASAAPSTGDLADDQTLRIDLGQEPPTLDPNKAQDNASIAVLHGLNRGLVYFDKDLKLVPALAAALPEVSADSKTLTFTLKDGLKYSNGDPIVAGDFVYSIKRTLDPRLAAPYAYVLTEIEGANDLLALAGTKPGPTDAQVKALMDKVGVTAPDPKTVVVKLSTPATYFVDVLALWIAVPVEEKWITSPNATEAANYVSSGPFVLSAWNHNSDLTLKPNPNWSGDKPKLSAITMTMTTEPAQGQAAFEAGELDMVRTPSEDILRVTADPTLGPTVKQTATLGIDYYDFNNGIDPETKTTLARCADPKKCPTMNKDFRIALTQAVDKKAMIDATWAGVGAPANSMVMPGIPGYDESIDPYPFNLDQAKQHMTTALAALGVPDAASLGKLKFGFNSGSGHEPRVAFLAEAWRQAFGLQTEQIGSDFAVFLQQRHKGEYDLARDGWGADYPHANNQLSQFECYSGNNTNNWCSKDFDNLVIGAAAEPDQAKQEAAYKQAQAIMFNDAAMLPLRFTTVTNEVQPYVGGVQETPTDAWMPGDLFYESIFIKKH
jgi:oligopeptide transport system substrate-binding protein